MFASENTGYPCDEKSEEASRPTFQTPLRMKAASSGFLGMPKAAADGNQVQDDGPALPSLVLRVGGSGSTSRLQTEQLATCDVLPIDSHATGMVIHDENLSWTTESTVTGLVEVIASMDGEIANDGENENATEEASNSDWTNETDSDAEGWILDKVALRRNLSMVRSVSELFEASQLPGDSSEDSIEGPLEVLAKDSLECLLEDLLECPHKVLRKVLAECSVDSSSDSKMATYRDQILPNQEGECRNSDCAKADGDSRMDFGHGDFQADVGQDSVDPEMEDAINSRALNLVDLVKVDVDTKSEDSDTRLEADVDEWIEEARIEAEILIASNEESFPCDEANSEVQSDVPESDNEANHEESDITALQREEFDSTENTSDPNSARTYLSDIHSDEIYVAKLDSREDKHDDMNFAGTHSTEEKTNIKANLTEIINSKDISPPEMNTTEANFADSRCTEWQSSEIIPADNHSTEPTCVETYVPVVVTAVHNFPDTIYGVTQTPCSTFSISTTVELNNADVFKLTLPGTQTIGTKSAETQTEFDTDDSKSAASRSSKTPSSVSSYADTIPDDWRTEDSSNSSDMETAKMELADSISDSDTESEHVKNLENSNFPKLKPVDLSEKDTDSRKTEEELFVKSLEDSNFPSPKPVELLGKYAGPQETEEESLVKNLENSSFPDTKPDELSNTADGAGDADPQNTEEELLVKNLESSNFSDNKPDKLSDKSADSQKTAEEQRSEFKPSLALRLLLPLLRCTLGVWMHFWGPQSCS